MTYNIDTHLKDKDSKRYGRCRVCGTKVFWTRQKIESHKRSSNCHHYSSLTNYQLIEPTNSTVPDSNSSEGHHQAKLNDCSITPEKAEEYCDLLRQFSHLPLQEKKKYLKERAPETFIKLLRECVRNVRSANVPCSETLVIQSLCQYSFQRIDHSDATHAEVRNHLCESKTLDIFLKILPSVQNYLNSFQNKPSN